MCFPAIGLVAGLGMSMVQAGASMAAKQQQYDQQVRQYQQNVTNSEAADRDQQVQLALRQEQEQQATGQKIQQQSIAGAVKAAQVSASAAGANVTGLSVDNLINDVHFTVDENQGVLRQNAQNTAEQLQAQKEAGVNQDQSRINSLAVPVAPDPTGDLLGVGGAALKDFGKFDSTQSAGGANFFGMSM